MFCKTASRARAHAVELFMYAHVDAGALLYAAPGGLSEKCTCIRTDRSARRRRSARAFVVLRLRMNGLLYYAHARANVCTHGSEEEGALLSMLVCMYVAHVRKRSPTHTQLAFAMHIQSSSESVDVLVD